MYPKNFEKGVANPKLEKHPAPKLNKIRNSEFMAIAYSGMLTTDPSQSPNEHPFIARKNSTISHLRRSVN